MKEAQAKPPPSAWWNPAEWWTILSFSWIGPMIAASSYRELGQEDATAIISPSDDAPELSAQFEAAYSTVQEKHGNVPPSALLNNTTRTLIWLYRWNLVMHSFWVAVEISIRLTSPVVLREFLRWISSYAAGEGPDTWRGWMLAVALGVEGFAMAILHHRLFWVGMKMGFTMRQQCIAAVHAKVLRLSAAAVTHISQGHVVNLVSGDVRRFDDATPFWIFLWAGPLELGMVLLMVSLELGFVPALAGVAATLALIPIQSALVRPVAAIRRATAQLTDERVRLTSEVIQGALAMKMLSWELPFSKALAGIRAQEAANIRKMARIRAVNMALNFAITPVVSFATFATYRGLKGQLDIASVFYALSLLNLPKLYMVQFFVLGVQYCTEMRVSLSRLDKFLSVEEPPMPVHAAAAQHTGTDTAPNQPGPAVPTKTDGGAPATTQPLHATDMQPAGTAAAHAQPDTATADRAEVPMNVGGKAAAGQVIVDHSPAAAKDIETAGSQANHARQAGGSDSAVQHVAGVVAMQGADYDWLRPLGHVMEQQEHAGDKSEAVSRANSTSSSKSKAGKGKRVENSKAVPLIPPEDRTVTLRGVMLHCEPGELLGICGEVGSGKSSILAALLGELLPLPQDHDLAMKGQPQLLPGHVQTASNEGVRDRQSAGHVQLQVHAQQPAGQGLTGKGPVMVGRVAYCAQVPWIVAGSVRENILFGRPYDEAFYQCVLKACALETDIAMLPAGDLTELGERGINLSGGQKARVALARAAYARADVCLLDDPLSAVDPRVGRILFNSCLGPQGIMQGSTRVLVTHQRQFLPRCDRVLVMRQGEVVACGPWEQIAALQLPELNAGAAGFAAETEVTVDDAVEAVVEQQQTRAVQQGAGEVLPETSSTETAESSQLNGMAAPGGAVSQSHTPPSHDVSKAVSNDNSTATGNNQMSAPRITIPTVPEDETNDTVGGDMNGHVGVYSVNGYTTAAPYSPGPTTGTPTMQRRPSFMRRALSGMFARGGRPQAGNFSNGTTKLWYSNSLARSRGRGSDLSLHAEDAETCKDTTETVAADKAEAGGINSMADTVPMAAREWSHWWRGNANRVLERARSLAPGRNRVPEPDLAMAAADKGDKGKLVQDEDRILGSVSWKVYGHYFYYAGPISSAFIFVGMFAGQAVYLAADWWLALWSRASHEDQKDMRWLWVYGMLTGLVVVLAFSRSVLFFETTLTAATRIHDIMARTVFRAPLSFFHTNPAGRVLNRFSKDQGQVDDLLPITMFDAFQCGFLVLSALVLVSIAVPVVLPVLLPIAIIFYYLRGRYLTASREVKRFEATTRSPVYASFSATLKGLTTIRAYAAQSRWQSLFLGMLSLNGSWWHAFLGTSRWVGFRLDLISAFTLLAAALLAMATVSRVQPSLLALAMTNVLQLTGFMQWFVRQTAESENLMTSMERMLAYTELPQEPPLVEEGAPQPPAGWPRTGALEYRNVSACYRAGLPPVLRNISFSLKAGSACGVVGRTGSGKSSLMLTLFRLIDVTEGTILLDGLDTASIGLDALRKQLAIIPQDPVLFSGTVRSNLDPWRTHNDTELWEVLRAAKLQPAIKAAGGLDARMAEAGDNLSVGQRQLFCLARALLSQAKVLALDEATANVDRGTDAVIQTTLRDFAHNAEAGRVIVVIAHRIDTIMDTDMLIVLQAGRLVEQGPPSVLAATPGSLFGGMVSAAYGSAPPLPALAPAPPSSSPAQSS